jgi:hypothetical protein
MADNCVWLTWAEFYALGNAIEILESLEPDQGRKLGQVVGMQVARRCVVDQNVLSKTKRELKKALDRGIALNEEAAETSP